MLVYRCALILLVVCGVQFQPIKAATYYIVPSGGNNSNPGTEAQPWATFNKFLTTHTSGDKLILRGGIYYGNTNGQIWSGVAQKHNVTYEAYPGETPIIADFTNTSAGAAFFYNNGATNINVNGIIFSNSFANVLIRSTTYINFTDCKFGWGWRHTNHNYTVNVALWDYQYIKFTNCGFIDWGIMEGGDDGGAPITLGGFNEALDTNAYGAFLYRCYFDHGGHDNFEVYTRSNMFIECIFRNPRFYDWLGTNYGNRNGTIMTKNARRNLFDGCLFLLSGRPVDDDECPGLEISSADSIIRRCAFAFHAGPSYEYYDKGTSFITPSNNYLYSLTSFKAAQDGDMRIDAQVGLWALHTTVISNKHKNLLFWDIGTNHTKPAITMFTYASNYFAGLLTNTVDPLFVNTNRVDGEITSWAGGMGAGPDLRVRQGSPAIDAGVFLTTITSATGSGTTIVLDDVGYFHDGWGIPGVVGDIIQLEGTTTTTTILTIDYFTDTITVSPAISWTQGQGVSLPYNGLSPDIGAFEWIGSTNKAVMTGNAKISGSAVLR